MIMKELKCVVSTYTVQGGAAGVASPPPQNTLLWCGAALPRRTTTHIQYVLAQHRKN